MSNKIINNHTALCLAALQNTGTDPATLWAEAAISGTRVNMIRRAYRRYHAALAAAPKFGLIGVGIISFADARLEKFCRRVNLTV